MNRGPLLFALPYGRNLGLPKKSKSGGGGENIYLETVKYNSIHRLNEAQNQAV